MYSDEPTHHWKPDHGLGYHRILLNVPQKTDAVYIKIMWRRRDTDFEKKGFILQAGVKTCGIRVKNIYIITLTQSCLEMVFQPIIGAGIYALYYQPSRWIRSSWNNPIFVPIPLNHQPSLGWLKRNGLDNKSDIDFSNFPVGQVKVVEAYDSFHSFYPMEVTATNEEVHQIIEHYSSQSFLVFPEARENPIRMRDFLPFRWIEQGPNLIFRGKALIGEYFTFQLGIFASIVDLVDLRIEFANLLGFDHSIFPHSIFTCFNLEGQDWLNKHFTKSVNVPKGKIQALWCGLNLPEMIHPGEYTSEIKIIANNDHVQKIKFNLTVIPESVTNRGYNEDSRFARLNWLNSAIGLNDDVIRPYSPLIITNSSNKGSTSEKFITLLGRSVHLNTLGFPSQIISTFTRNNDRVDGPARNILHAPIEFNVDLNSECIAWEPSTFEICPLSTGAANWHVTLNNPIVSCEIDAKIEADGYLNYSISVCSKRATLVRNIALIIPIQADIAEYFMGLGLEGGKRPRTVEWTWHVNQSNNMMWIGTVNAGLQCKLKHLVPDWAINDLYATGPYRDWSNGGKGGARLTEDGEKNVIFTAYTGDWNLQSGQQLIFNFGLLITPFHILDQDHWQYRYYHNCVQKQIPTKILQQMQKFGAKIVNIHHANNLNPFINYPFFKQAGLLDLIERANINGIRVKLYYTIRELTVRTQEFWMLWSLGDEIFTQGLGSQIADQFTSVSEKKQWTSPFGYAWLEDHLDRPYDPAWHHRFKEGFWDCSIRTTGLSRWHNFYLEGLAWLVKQFGIRGIYLDGVGYDREIMKRLRRVLNLSAPDCLIDFHSGNNYHPLYGLNNVANGYLELFPYFNSLWVGEGQDYNRKPPDYWLIEISGIPYGLFGEMLHAGGNPYRGMVYGMTNRFPWAGKNPSGIWRFWDEFQIQTACMIGYWDKTNPIKANSPNIYITIYQHTRKILIAGASWGKNSCRCEIYIDWKKIGWNPDKTRACFPLVKPYQRKRKLNLPIVIRVKPLKGFWILLENHE